MAFLHKHSYVSPYYSDQGGERYQKYHKYNQYSNVVHDKTDGNRIALAIADDVEKYWSPKSSVFCGFFHETQTFSIDFQLCDYISPSFEIGNNEKYHQIEVGDAIARTIVKQIKRIDVEVLGKVFSAMRHYKIDRILLRDIIKPFATVERFEEEETARKCLYLAGNSETHKIYLKRLEGFEVRLGEKHIEYFHTLEILGIVPHKEMMVENPVSFIFFIGTMDDNISGSRGIRGNRKRLIQYFMRHEDGVFRRLLAKVAAGYLLFFLTHLPKDVLSEVVCFFLHLYLLK